MWNSYPALVFVFEPLLLRLRHVLHVRPVVPILAKFKHGFNIGKAYERAVVSIIPLLDGPGHLVELRGLGMDDVAGGAIEVDVVESVP